MVASTRNNTNDYHQQRFSSRIPRASPRPPSSSPLSSPSQLNHSINRVNTVASAISAIAKEAAPTESPHTPAAHNTINSDYTQGNRLWSNSRSNREAPWIKDQRQSPRSVRTPSPYRQQQQQNIKRNTINPFDSPSTVTTSASRNPSPTEGEGNRSAPSAMYYTRRTNNPIDSPSGEAIRKNVANGGTNPFDIDVPVKARIRDECDELDQFNRLETHHPFDSGSSCDNSIIDKSLPHVRVTVHTEQNNQHRAPNQQRHQQQQQQQQPRSPSQRQHRKLTKMPFSPISGIDETNLGRRQDPSSVTIDSLERILDTTTEETVDEEDEGKDHFGYRDEPKYNEAWSDEPHLQHQHEQFEQHSHSKIPPTPTPSYFSSSCQTASSNTPSEKALLAAESLRKSFDNRRRQQRNGNVTPVTIATTTAPKEAGALSAPILVEDNQIKAINPNNEDNSIHSASDVSNIPVVSSNRKQQFGRANPINDIESGAVVSGRNENKIFTIDPNEQQQQQHQLLDSDSSSKNNGNDYTLHDLCDEAISTDDLAWHNALYLLSIRPDLGLRSEPKFMMTPLHVACLAQEPPPVWMTRGLLIAAPESCRQADKGGRLPLHLLVATSAHIDTIRLLVEEHPAGVSHKDDRGFTPIQLLLKRNDPIRSQLTLQHLRFLLGQTQESKTPSHVSCYEKEGVHRCKNDKLSFRRGDHLKLQDLDFSVAEERVTRHESMFREYSDGIRQALTKLSQWKRRQINKNRNGRKNGENQVFESTAVNFVNPASIATPTGHLLPLHLLVRKNTNIERTQDILSVKKAETIDLLRIMIAAYPQGLVEVDANGKTPLMTAMLQMDSSPSEEVIELLLGLRTPGCDGIHGIGRPALIASGDTFQLPLHVAAEELLSKYSILSTICEAYPDARTVQDIRGRTPLHLAFQNYRSVPVDEATLALLFTESVAKIKDDDGNTPLDIILQNPKSFVRGSSSCSERLTANEIRRKEYHVTILQEFFDASIDEPLNRREAQNFIAKFKRFPPWLRRQACAARFVQDILVSEISSPFTTFRILGSGFVLTLLLISLRRMLHINADYSLLIYYLATYLFIMQLIHWGSSIYVGEFFRLCVANLWRWFDLATVVLSMWCAIYISGKNSDEVNDSIGDDPLFSALGVSATLCCWLSLLGYMVEWCCGLAVFIGSATQLLSVLVWPLFVAVMGFFATSQVLFTVEDCTTGGICSLSEAYALVYRLVIGVPVLTDTDYNVSKGTFVIVVISTVLYMWWIMSVIAMIITEANRLDRRRLSLIWYWEPKIALTATLSVGSNDKVSDSPSCIERYCDTSEKIWHIFVTALRGEQSEVHWDAYCFRSKPITVVTGLFALFLLPIWFILGLVTLGLLWPPQIRRWIFYPGPIGNTLFGRSCTSRSGSNTTLSQLRRDMNDLKTSSYDQNHQIQHDLGVIKEVIFRATMESE